MSLTLREFQAANASRANDWHGDLTGWSGLEWAGAMCGEAGEAANTAKKLRRLEQGLIGNSGGDTMETLIFTLGEELADTITYACLLASRYGINLEHEAVRKFNAVSAKHGFPHRL